MAALIPAVEWLAWRCSWSNNKAVWVNTPAADGRGMTCEEDMVKQVEMIKATHPDKRVFVYRNIVNAYPWMTSIRKLLDDPAFDVWFLRFKPGADGQGPLHHDGDGTYRNPVCDHSFSPPRCSELWHSQTQTPHYAPNGTCAWNKTTSRCDPVPGAFDFGDGMCIEKPCDCGRVPCGFYLFDHRQWNTAVKGQTLREWFIQNLTISETGLLHPDISGFFLDDTWGGNGAGDLDGSEITDVGLSKADLAEIKGNWSDNFDAVKAAILQHGGFSWQQLVGACSEKPSFVSN
jgi:hypothetical protein